MMRPFLFPVVFMAMAAAAGRTGAATTDTTPLPSILDGVIARDAQTQRELKSLEYDQTVHTERLDTQGHVTGHQDVKMIVRPGASPEIQVVQVKGDDIPTDPDQAAQKAKGQEIARHKQNFDLKTIAAHFNITLQGTSTELGPKAYVLAFEPKPNQPYTTQTEKVLDQLHGRMWVRASDNTILRTQATLLHPVDVAWILVTIDQLDFHYELPAGGSEYGPAWMETSVEIAAPLIRIHQRQRVDMDHFRPREPISAMAKKM
jgi:hypothetical protein